MKIAGKIVEIRQRGQVLFDAVLMLVVLVVVPLVMLLYFGGDIRAVVDTAAKTLVEVAGGSCGRGYASPGLKRLLFFSGVPGGGPERFFY